MTIPRNQPYKRKASQPLFAKDLKKMKFDEYDDDIQLKNVFTRIRIEADGNCLFRAIQYCLTGKEENHEFLRKQVCQHLEENADEYKNLYQRRKRVNTFKKYLDLLKCDGCWGDHLELTVLSKLHDFNVIIYKPNSLEIYSEHIEENSPSSKPLFHLEYENYNHYNVFTPKNTAKAKNFFKYFINKKAENNLIQTKCKNQKVKINLPKAKSPIENENSQYLDAKKDQNDETDPLKKKVVKRKNSSHQNNGELYPLAKKGYDTYNEAYKYLRNKAHPGRINNAKSLKYWKKEIESRYFLAKTRQSTQSQSKLQTKFKNNIYKTIPFEEEILNLIDAAHNGFNQPTIKHNGIRMTLRNLGGPSMQLYWANMSADVKNYTENCIQCIHEQPVKQTKVYKPIISAGPFDRFTADLYALTKEMLEASGTNYRYILSCVDHFSKYKWAELIENKEASTVAHKLELIFNSFRAPVHFQTDNGKEFQNAQVYNLCKRKNIKQVHSRPYYPQSQGVVEKLNDLIAKSLRSSLRTFKKDKNKTVWNIEDSLKAWTINSNKNLHSVTKLIPYIAITLTDSQQIQKTQENIRQYYDKKQANKSKKDAQWRCGMKVFIIKEIKKVVGKNKLIPRERKNLVGKKGNKAFRVPAEVTSILQLKYSLVEIKILGEIDFELDLDRNYYISVDHLEIAKSIKSWELLVKRKSLSL